MLFKVTFATGFYSLLVFLYFEICIALPGSGGGGLGFVYVISLFTFESSIVLSLITLYKYINTSFPHRSNNKKCTKRRKTWQKTIPHLLFQKFIQKTHNENSSLFAFCIKVKTKVETQEQDWETSELCPETSTKSYFHEFQVWSDVYF